MLNWAGCSPIRRFLVDARAELRLWVNISLFDRGS